MNSRVMATLVLAVLLLGEATYMVYRGVTARAARAQEILHRPGHRHRWAARRAQRSRLEQYFRMGWQRHQQRGFPLTLLPRGHSTAAGFERINVGGGNGALFAPGLCHREEPGLSSSTSVTTNIRMAQGLDHLPRLSR